MPRARNLIAFAGLLVVGGCFVLIWNRPTHGYGYTREASPIYGLPEDASDIDFYDYGYMPNTAFSFQTTEANFNTWSRTFGGISLISDRSGSIFYIEPTGEGHAVSTGDGIEYGWTEEDRGQHIRPPNPENVSDRPVSQVLADYFNNRLNVHLVASVDRIKLEPTKTSPQ